jgi:hypothetical protein
LRSLQIAGGRVARNTLSDAAKQRTWKNFREGFLERKFDL